MQPKRFFKLGSHSGSIATTVLMCLVFVTCVVGMFVYSVSRTPVLSPEELAQRGVVLWPKPRELRPFALTTANGEVFDGEDLEGRWSFMFFGFTNCPDICPVTLSEMGQAERALIAEQPELAAQFQGVLITVDPQRDTAEALRNYVQAFSKSFVGVRGEHRALAEFAKDVNAAFARMPSEEGPYQIDHTGTLVIINPMGHYHGFIKLPHKADIIQQTFTSLALSF
ncbi:MAG: SCO family protein [Pseudomonadales bacterium]